MANNEKFPFDEVLEAIARANGKFQEPAVTQVAERTRDPFRVLISCVISLRTKDEVTAAASRRLFALAPDVRSMAKLAPEQVEKAIFPAGFYRNKARHILEISKRLLEEHGGKVPADLDALLALPGVGRKTANLVLSIGHGVPAICVDTHVHRICNRLGWVQTKTPEKTEFALREILPRRYWIPINDLLVTFGQNLCKPISPYCSRCPVSGYCEKNGVERYR